LLIPNISRITYDIANECAICLWNGIDYESGNEQLVSDAYLLDIFGSKFIRAKVHKSTIFYTLDEVSKFIKVAKLSHHINPNSVDISTARKSLNNTVMSYAIRNKNQRYGIVEHKVGALLADNLGRHFASKRFVIRNGKRIRTQNNKTTLASRLLFFTVPSQQIFNLNEDIALALQLNGKRASKFNDEYCYAFATLLDRDWHILSNFKMPIRTKEISQSVWNEAYYGCWWQRRVLDLAVMLHFKIINATYVKSYFGLSKPKLPFLFKNI
jgi:hypothetical protein